MLCCWLWRWRKTLQAKELRQPLEVKEARKRFSLRTSKETDLPDTLNFFSTWQWFGAFDFWNGKIINVYCLKPLKRELIYSNNNRILIQHPIMVVFNEAFWEMLQRRLGMMLGIKREIKRNRLSLCSKSMQVRRACRNIKNGYKIEYFLNYFINTSMRNHRKEKE